MNPIAIHMISALVDFHSITVRLVGGDSGNLFGSAEPLLYVVWELLLRCLLLSGCIEEKYSSRSD